MNDTLSAILILVLIPLGVWVMWRVTTLRDEREKEHQVQEFERVRVKRENQLRKNEELFLKMVEIIKDNFKAQKCSRCNDVKVSLVEINSVGTGIKYECQTCSKAFWITANQDFDSGDQLRSLWEMWLDLEPIEGSPNGFHTTIPIEKPQMDGKDSHRPTIKQSVKDEVWNRDGGKCVQCGSMENLEFDHIIPFSKGGASTYRNLQLLCESCNRRKWNKIG